jgi:acetolactate synthase-1/3 small subunit
VTDVTNSQFVVRETALVKIHAPEPRREEIRAVAEGFGARVIGSGPQSVVVEMTDTPDRLGEMIALAQVLGACETMRSGSLAMALGAAIPRDQPPTVDDRGRPWWSQADGAT